MKKNITIEIFIGFCLLNSSCYGYVAGKMTKFDTLIYCPPQVVCTQANNLNSCSYDNTFSNYWDKSSGINNPSSIMAGTHILSSVGSAYHYSNNYQMARCAYSIAPNVNSFYLVARLESNLEAYTDKSTAWVINKDSAYCQNKSASLCPMIEQSSLKIINYYTKDGVWAAIDGINVIDEKVPFNTEQLNDISYKKVFFDNILYKCGSFKVCKIDIENVKGQILGSVTVDMDNHMKILEIINAPYSNSKIEKIEPFNTITVRSNLPPVNYSVELYNYTNTDITPRVGYVDLIDKPIANGKHDSIYLDRALSACKTNSNCQVDIKNYKGSLFGSIIIDLNDNMKILEVLSIYPLEIVLNKFEPNSVEVKYLHK